MRVVLVHDWLTGMRGGEVVLEELLRLFPAAAIHTLLHEPGSVSPAIEARIARTSGLQGVPFLARRYKRLLPVLPLLVRELEVSGAELAISVSHCVAKGVPVAPPACHLCYCLTPMRYVWDRFDDYRSQGMGTAARLVAPLVRGALRRWDVATASGPDAYAACSGVVADRIRRYYGREARVVYPPVDCGFFTPGGRRGDYYLSVSALVPYKRLDVAVRAFRKLGRRLLIVGTGEMEGRLRAEAGPATEFLGWVGRERLRELYRGARALVYCAFEDFGLAPVEAMACGVPVIAFGEGGVVETVVEGATGRFYRPQEADALVDAVREFERAGSGIDPVGCRARALRFDRERFAEAFRAFVEESM